MSACMWAHEGGCSGPVVTESLGPGLPPVTLCEAHSTYLDDIANTAVHHEDADDDE